MDFRRRIRPATPDHLFTMSGYYVWDPSVVRDEPSGKYLLYGSRYPTETSRETGWLMHSSVFYADGATPLGPFRFVRELTELKGQQWSRHMVHNPKIVRVGETWCLFYIGTHWGEADPDKASRRVPEHYNIVRYNQRIGVATAPTAHGPWTPSDKNPVIDVRLHSWDAALTANPAPWVGNDGNVYCIYKSAPLPDGRPLLLGLAVADSVEGPYRRIGKSPLQDHDIEDPFVWKENGVFWMLAKDMQGSVSGLRHGGVLYTSKDGIDWRVAENSLGYDLTIRFTDGTESRHPFVERPHLYIEDGRPTAIYHGVSDKESYAYIVARAVSRVSA